MAGPVAMPRSVVEVKGLTKVYGGNARKGHADVRAVDQVDLTVSEGELVVLLGPSGCGKTTLLRCIAGLEKPVAGEIAIGGKTVFSSARGTYVPPEERRIGMMFQSYALWPHMTVLQNVAYPLASHPGTRGDTRERVLSLLDRLGVASLDHRYPGELSGGQQQRVALARALVAAPSVILFDEPLSNVDAKVRRRLRAELRELKAQTNFAGVYVTHDQEEAMELADTLAVMESGQIRQRATGREIYRQPASIYVADFVGEINRWQGRIEKVIGGGARVSSALGDFTVGGVDDSVRPGDTGWLAIRPERVGVESPVSTTPGTNGCRPPSDSRALRGHVHDAIYLGARLEYRIRLPNLDLTAWLHDHGDSAAMPARGDSVDVVLPQDSLRWLAQ